MRKLVYLIAVLMFASGGSGAGAEVRPRPQGMSGAHPIVIEGEALLSTAKASAGPVARQEMGSFGAQWSGGAQLFWRPPAPVDAPIRNWPHLDLWPSVPKAGRYSVALVHTVAPDFGRAHVFFREKPVADIDGFAPSVSLRTVQLGEFDLDSGLQHLILTVFSRNSDSKNYFVGVDRLELRPAGTTEAGVSGSTLSLAAQAIAVAAGSLRIPPLPDPAMRRDLERLADMSPAPPLSETEKKAILALAAAGKGGPGKPIVLRARLLDLPGVASLDLTGCYSVWPRADLIVFPGKTESESIQAGYNVAAAGKPFMVSYAIRSTHVGQRPFHISWGPPSNVENEQTLLVNPGGQNLTVTVIPMGTGWYSINLQPQGDAGQFILDHVEITPLQ